MEIVNVIGQVQGFSVLAAGLLISLAALGTGIGFGLLGGKFLDESRQPLNATSLKALRSIVDDYQEQVRQPDLFVQL